MLQKKQKRVCGCSKVSEENDVGSYAQQVLRSQISWVLRAQATAWMLQGATGGVFFF
jgi:hypothetical protein